MVMGELVKQQLWRRKQHWPDAEDSAHQLQLVKDAGKGCRYTVHESAAYNAETALGVVGICINNTAF